MLFENIPNTYDFKIEIIMLNSMELLTYRKIIQNGI